MIYTDPVADIIAAAVLINTIISSRIARKQKNTAKQIEEVHEVVTNGKDE